MGADLKVYEKVKKEKKKFSFVIPVYKTEEFLWKSLLSLVSKQQDYSNIEVIVVFDGKSEEGEKIVEELRVRDKRIKKPITIEHGGAPKARNEGFKYVTGDYVSFWDSDCYARPGMIRTWAEAFETRKDVDFVYSGYGILDNNNSYLRSEQFNPYLLTCYNYIATMFPMKKEVFPGFDESLKSLQDWDMWLTIVERGGKGQLMESPVAGFDTEIRPEGISNKNCTDDVWVERFNTVKEKHKNKRDNVVFGNYTKMRSIQVAEMLGYDYLGSNQLFHPIDHKNILMIGLFPADLQEYSQYSDKWRTIPKIIHWVGCDIDEMLNCSYRVIKALPDVMQRMGVIRHYADNETAQLMLEEIGIKSEVMALPMTTDVPKMPEKFKVFVESDKETQNLLEQITRACPDIEFTFDAPVEDVACYMGITGSVMPSENLKRFGATGRFLITNYRMLYAGYTEVTRVKIIEKLRECKRDFEAGKVNTKQMEHFGKITLPSDYVRRVHENFKG